MSLVQVHLKERMHALEEKNNLSTELHQTRKKLEELANQKVRALIYSLKSSVADPSDPYVFGPPRQCCGSGMFSRIPDPTFFHPGSRIRTVSIPDPHQRI